jgi:hypothetical protein
VSLVCIVREDVLLSLILCSHSHCLDDAGPFLYSSRVPESEGVTHVKCISSIWFSWPLLSPQWPDSNVQPFSHNLVVFILVVPFQCTGWHVSGTILLCCMSESWKWGTADAVNISFSVTTGKSQPKMKYMVKTQRYNGLLAYVNYLSLVLLLICTSHWNKHTVACGATKSAKSKGWICYITRLNHAVSRDNYHDLIVSSISHQKGYSSALAIKIGISDLCIVGMLHKTLTPLHSSVLAIS